MRCFRAAVFCAVLASGVAQVYDQSLLKDNRRVRFKSLSAAFTRRPAPNTRERADAIWRFFFTDGGS